MNAERIIRCTDFCSKLGVFCNSHIQKHVDYLELRNVSENRFLRGLSLGTLKVRPLCIGENRFYEVFRNSRWITSLQPIFLMMQDRLVQLRWHRIRRHDELFSRYVQVGGAWLLPAFYQPGRSS